MHSYSDSFTAFLRYRRCSWIWCCVDKKDCKVTLKWKAIKFWIIVKPLATGRYSLRCDRRCMRCRRCLKLCTNVILRCAAWLQKCISVAENFRFSLLRSESAVIWGGVAEWFSGRVADQNAGGSGFEARWGVGQYGIMAVMGFVNMYDV